MFDPIEVAWKIRKEQIEAGSKFYPDEFAVEVPHLFPHWAEGQTYSAGDRVQFDGTLYKVLTGHTSQAAWTPAAAPSLFTKVLTQEGIILPWEQPESTNPYAKGDRVTHNGKIWESTIDGNVWEPGVYGWIEVTE